MAHTLYENKVLENKMTDLVNTNIDVNALFTVDNSLEGEAGLKKVINKYAYSGTVEELAKGDKNDTIGEVTFVPSEYEVKRYQQTFAYNDMDVMQDPYILDVATKGASEVMANHIRKQYFDELAKISNEHEVEAFNYDAVVDALAEIGREVENDTFIVMGLGAKADIRKDEDFKASRQGEILYTGQFGTIAGIPCIFSKLVDEVAPNTIFVTTKDQVKLFVKKSGSVEQDRDIETKDNVVVYDRHGLMALVDETKSIKIVKKSAESEVTPEDPEVTPEDPETPSDPEVTPEE